MTKRTQEPRWWAVVVEGEEPDVYGPYRSEAAAQAVADEWNGWRQGEEFAWTLPMKSGPVH